MKPERFNKFKEKLEKRRKRPFKENELINASQLSPIQEIIFEEIDELKEEIKKIKNK